MKHGEARIDDFTVQMNEIPISAEKFNDDRDLLTAMMVTHFEDIVSGESQVLDELEDVQTNQG